MPNHSARQINTRVASQSQPQVEIDIFHVGEKVFIKSARLFEGVTGVSSGSGTSADHVSSSG